MEGEDSTDMCREEDGSASARVEPVRKAGLWQKATHSLTCKDMAVLFAASAVVYVLQAFAWPLHPGRDLASYLIYYVDMSKATPTYCLLMAFRTPIVPLFIGLTNFLGGPLLLEVAQGLLFCCSILFMYSIGSHWSGRIGLMAAVALVLYPPYGALYHEVSADCVFAFAFLGWSAYLFRSFSSPSISAFLWHGAAVFALVLIRPSSQILLAFAFAPLFLQTLSLRQRVLRSAVFLGAAVPLLLLWATYNDVRYHDFTISRGTNATIPFYRLWCVNRVVRPENGPASRKLADAVRNDLLVHEPYLSYGIDEKAFFSCGDPRMWSDLVALSDRTWGWDSDYKHLRSVALEALARYPGVYVKALVRDLLGALLHHGYLPDSIKRKGEPVSEARLNARGLPMPSEGQLIPRSYFYWFSTNPWNRAVPEERLAQLQVELQALGLDIPRRDGSGRVATLLNYLTQAYPPMLTWLVVGLFAMAFRAHPARRTLLILLSLSALVLVVTFSGMELVYQYRIPFDPLFILAGVAGVLHGGRSRSPSPPNARCPG
jgi:hypothetical protein